MENRQSYVMCVFFRKPAYMSYRCVEIKKLRNPQHFAQMVYRNFEYLKEDPVLKHTVVEIQQLLSSNDGVLFVVYDPQGALVAYLLGEIMTLQDNRMVFYVSYVFVSQKHRGRRIGSQLIERMIQKCQQIGLNFVVLTCDTMDHKVYEYYLKMGFVDDPILGQNKSRHRVMVKYLI